MARPRIVLEESPLARFFGDLPSTVLSFIQLNQQMEFRAEEAEKARQFQESQVYLANLLATERDLTNRIYEKIDEAEDYGINIAPKIDAMDKLHSTAGGPALAQLGQDLHDTRINEFRDLYGDISNDLSLFHKGRQVSDIIDENKDGILSGDEFLSYQDELQETDPGFALPEALKLGAQFAITDPASRLQKIQLKGAQIGIEKGQQEVKLFKAQIKEIESKVGKAVADEYRSSGVLPIGTASYQDLAVAQNVMAEWQYMDPNILNSMVSNTLTTYDDPVSDQIDKEDIQYAIIPYMKKYAEDKISNPDYREAVGLTDQDVEAKNEKYLKVIQSITSNALSGVRKNEAYTLKSQKDILESRTMNRAAMKQMFSDAELGTYNKAVETLANVLPIVPDTGEPSEAHVETIQENLKSAGLNWDETKIYTEYMRLRGAQDPYTIAITIQQNKDSQTLLKALGQESFVAIMQQATAALQTTPGAPMRRVAKEKKAPPRTPPQTPPGAPPGTPPQTFPSTSIGQLNLDERIKEAALLSLDIQSAKEEGQYGNIDKVSELTEKLDFVEQQIQQLIDQGFQPGAGSLQDITLNLPTR